MQRISGYIVIAAILITVAIPARADKINRNQDSFNNEEFMELQREEMRKAISTYKYTKPATSRLKPSQPIKNQKKQNASTMVRTSPYTTALKNADGITPTSMTTSSRANFEWQYAISRMKNQNREDQIRNINTLVNQTPYVSDKKNYGANEYWATPAQFMAKGGDCEDYALAKYASLRALGIPADDMRIVGVSNKEGKGHAILVVKTQKGDVVLDNASDKVKNINDVPQYKPEMSVSNKGLSVYKNP